MAYYDVAVNQHGWADNNFQICARYLARDKEIAIFNEWLGQGLKLLESGEAGVRD